MKVFLFGMASIPLMAGLAQAQEAAGPAANLGEIVVTAPGPDRTADELIGSASVLDRGRIVERLATTLGDTLDREPGVATTFFGAGASRPVLRGLGAERVQVLTNGLGVIDASAASPDHQVTADGIDAEKIEILRGPAALAYGGQAIGGVVNVIDGLILERAPERPLFGEAFAAATTVDDGRALGARATAALGPLALTLSASERNGQNYDIPVLGESARLRAAEGETEAEPAPDSLENSFVETETLAAGVSLIGERGFLGVAVRRTTSEYGLPGHGHEHEGEGEEPGDAAAAVEEEEEGEELPFIDLEQTRIDLRGGYTLDDGVLRRLNAALAFADYEHTEFEAPGEPGTRYESDGLEGRVELDYALGAAEGAIGLQALDKTLEAFGAEAFITPTDTQSFGVFLYQTREWDNGAGVEGGLRFDRTELDNISFGTADFTLVSGSLGVHRHYSNGWFLGAQASYTERAPNESELFADGPHLATRQFEIGDRTLKKERGLNLEGAARWRGERLSFGANVFYTRFEDFVFLSPGLTEVEGVLVDEVEELPVFRFRQDAADFLGGELVAGYALPAGPLGADWDFNASLDYVHAELEDGRPVPFIPPLTLNAGAHARFFGVLGLGADVTLAAEQDEPGEGSLPTDSYAALDLRGSLALSAFGFREGTEAFVQARNVTDEEIRYATSVLKDLAPAPGRNIRAGLRVTF